MFNNIPHSLILEAIHGILSYFDPLRWVLSQNGFQSGESIPWLEICAFGISDDKNDISARTFVQVAKNFGDAIRETLSNARLIWLQKDTDSVQLLESANKMQDVVKMLFDHIVLSLIHI